MIDLSLETGGITGPTGSSTSPMSSVILTRQDWPTQAHAIAFYGNPAARGWESKSVEEQMASESKPSVVTNPNAERKLQQRESADKARELQTLTMQRENILSQRTASPVRRAALAAALEQVEAQIARLS